MDKLWLVGQWTGDEVGECAAWEFQGIFKTEERAIKECRTYKYFIVPVFVGEPKPHTSEKWEGLYYPIIR